MLLRSAISESAIPTIAGSANGQEKSSRSTCEGTTARSRSMSTATTSPRMRTIRPMEARNRAGSISGRELLSCQLSPFSSHSLKSVILSEAKDLLSQRQKISWEHGCERPQHAIRELLFSSLALKSQIMPRALYLQQFFSRRNQFQSVLQFFGASKR